MNTSQKLIAVLVAGGLSYGAYQLAFASKGDGPQQAMAVPVGINEVVQKEVVEWDEFSGRLEAVDKVDVRPRVEGTIEAVHFKEGAVVMKGDPLFTIDPRPYAAEKNRAEAAMNSAKARLELARIEYKRAKPLLKDKAITQREYDVRANSFSVAESDYEAAKAAYEKASLNYEYAHITAPISGKVGRAEITVGNMVQSGSSAPILTSIVSYDPVYVDFEADEQAFLRYIKATNGISDLSNIPVFMGLASEQGTPHSGKILSFDNQVNTMSGTIRIRAQFANPEGTYVPGLYARVKIGGSGKNAAILIKDEAVGTDQSKKYVMVVDAENKANYREVKLGPVVEGMRVVREGLKPGEKVVVSGLQKLQPGSLVVPEPAAGGEGAIAPAAGAAAETK